MRRLVVTALLLLAVVGLHGQTGPVITAVTASGTTLTLTGSGFGVHADFGGPAPFLNAAWNDFATGINGGNLALDGTNNGAWTQQTIGGRTPATRWARKDYNAATSDSVRRLGSLSLNMSGTTGTFYSTFHWRCATGSLGKFWRIYGDAQDIFLGHEAGNLTSFSSANGTPAPTTVWGTVLDPVKCATTWQRVEVIMRDTGGDDLIEVWLDGALAFRRGSQLPSLHRDIEGSAANERQQYVVPSWRGDGHTMDFGNMIDAQWWGVSEAFVDYTVARVELTDVATCATAKREEIQVPLTWTATSITAQLRPGLFVSGQTLYACVTTANGLVSVAGAPFVLGTTGGPVPPIPPVTPPSGSCVPPNGFTPVTSGKLRSGVFAGTTASVPDRMNLLKAAGWAIDGFPTSSGIAASCVLP